MNAIMNTSITYHDHDKYPCYDILYQYDDIFDDNKNPGVREYTFGILEITMNKTPMIKKPLFLYFTVDESESMHDLCNGNKTKMWHLKQTLCKIIEHIGRMNDLEVYIKVAAFNNNVRTIIHTTLVEKSNMDDLIKQIETIQPMFSTNIEMALDYAYGNISGHIKKYPNHRVTHIFLTDGDITSGSQSYNELCGTVEELEEKCSKEGVKCRSVFVGLGETHNHRLLTKMSKTNRSEYRFIDDAENAPIVYGEILSRILYPAIEDVCINIQDGGELYDWKTNTWKKSLYEDLIDSEAKKIYHIRVNTGSGYELQQLQVNILGEEEFTEKVTTYSVVVSSECIDLDLMKYVFRQKILEYLSGYLTYNKSKIKQLFKRMRTYMKEKEWLFDPFMVILCDDLVFVYKYHGMCSTYIAGRRVSQGSQYTYTPTLQKTQSDTSPCINDDMNKTIRFGKKHNLQRCFSVPVQQMYFDDDLEKESQAVDEDSFSIKPRTVFGKSVFKSPLPKTNLLDRAKNVDTPPNTQEKDGVDYDRDNDIDEYILKECKMDQMESTITSPYATCSRTSTIRALSQHDPDES